MSQAKPQILAVDDNPVNLLVYEALVKKIGADLISVASGEEALQYVEKCRPDMILLDVRLPGIDGFELCRILRRRSDTKSCLIVLITLLDDPEDFKTGYESGADDYLSKPIAQHEFHYRLKSLLRRQGFQFPDDKGLVCAGEDSANSWKGHLADCRQQLRNVLVQSSREEISVQQIQGLLNNLQQSFSTLDEILLGSSQ